MSDSGRAPLLGPEESEVVKQDPKKIEDIDVSKQVLTALILVACMLFSGEQTAHF
jgi:hypothetical protein